MVALMLRWCWHSGYWLYVAAGAYNTQRHYGLSPSHCGGSDFGYWSGGVFGKVLVESGVGKALANCYK